MRQKKIVLVTLICLLLLLFTSQVSGKRLYSWGAVEDISLDVSARSLHSYDGFDFVYSPQGYFDVFKDGLHQGRISFGVFGLINSVSQKKLMSDFNWTATVLENSSEKISVRLYNNNLDFQWWMDLNIGEFSALKNNPYNDDKTKNKKC